MWYNRNAYNTQKTLKKSSKKSSKKLPKKGLTNEGKCGIINELSDKNR